MDKITKNIYNTQFSIRPGAVMGAFNRPRFEAMARGVAQGKTVFQAALDAGYGKTSRLCYKHTQRDDWAHEVQRWKLELQRGGSNDLGPVITELMVGAEKAMALGTGVGMMAAARMLAEAGSLKRLMRDKYKEDEFKAWADRYNYPD